MIPLLVVRRIEDRLGGRWNGRITLNVKDGRVIEVEVAEKERLGNAL